MANTEMMKKESIYRLSKLNVLSCVIDDFQNKGWLYYTESTTGALYYINDEMKRFVKEIEERYKGMVYHIIHSKQSSVSYSQCFGRPPTKKNGKRKEKTSKRDMCSHM